MAEINLLARLPRGKRNVNARAAGKSDEVIRISKQYGQEYFDGPREYGYGGYRYDGRWIPIAEDIIKHFDLKPGMRVLDVGAAKGFLVKDLMKVCPGLEVFGIDISRYAAMNCEPEVIGRLHVGNANDLPFPDDSFDCVLSINTLHNFYRPGVIKALSEMKRVCRTDKMFVQVDSYRTEEQRQLFLEWVLTADFHDFPEGWMQVFTEAGYTGDYYWTILE
jgi:ubiquinone/menaquinone biosynthesis C-methylase UbiE